MDTVMAGVSFVRYSPHTSTAALTAEVVDCYRRVFADGPWHEWMQCPRCKKYWGTKDQDLLQRWNFQHCETTIEDFWPRKQVTQDLFHEITNETSCWLALIGGKVIGFCWGYAITRHALEQKLKITLDDEILPLLSDSLLAYQDEVGILSEYRGQKIAKALVKYRLADFLSQGLRVGLVRTRKAPEPSTTFLWYERIGYLTVASYPTDDGRVVLGRSFDGLPKLL